MRPWWGETFIAVGLLVSMAVLLWVARPLQVEGPDWRTFSRLGPLSRHAEYWFTPEAFDGNYWSVGYSAFVGIFLPTSDAPTVGLQITQAAMAVSLAAMVYVFTFRFGRRVRLTATAISVVNPAFYWMAWNGGYEILLGWLICTSLLLVWTQTGELRYARQATKDALSFSSGLLLSSAVLVASKSLVLIIVIAVMMILARWRSTWFYLIGAGIPLILWMARNLLVLGSANPLNSNGPVNLWIGNNPDATYGGFMEPPPLPPGAASQLQATLQTVISYPEFIVALTLRKFTRLLNPNYVYPDHVLAPQALVALHFFTAIIGLTLVLLFAAFLFGRIWVAPPIVPPVGLLAIVYLVFVLVHLPFLAEARFRAPLEPVLIAVAIPTAFFLARRMRAGAQGVEQGR